MNQNELTKQISEQKKAINLLTGQQLAVIAAFGIVVKALSQQNLLISAEISAALQHGQDALLATPNSEELLEGFDLGKQMILEALPLLFLGSDPHNKQCRS